MTHLRKKNATSTEQIQEEYIATEGTEDHREEEMDRVEKYRV
jgi:hypothetical protein